MNIVVFDHFDEIYADWEKLIENVDNSPFISPFWQKLWWEHFGEGDLYIAKIVDDKDIIGIAPLYLNGNVARFIGGTDLFDYQDLIFLKGYEELGVKAFLNHISKLYWDKIELVSIPEDSLNLDLLKRFSEDYGFIFEDTNLETSPGEYLPGTWEEYISSLSKKNRHELRRKLKRIDSHGYKFYKSSKLDILNSLPDFFRLHKLSSDDKSEFMTLEREQFFTEIAIHHIEKNQMNLSFLEMSGIRVATSFCFDYGSATYLYNSGFDRNFSSFSVGLICNALVIQSSIQEGKNYFDFLRGDERYKYHLGGVDKSVRKIVLHKK